MGQGGDLTNLNINCPNMRDIPYNQIPLQKVGDYWGFDTRSVTVQYTVTIAVFKMSSEVIKCPTIGAASFGQSPYIARHLPVRGVVGHNIDRRINAIKNVTLPILLHNKLYLFTEQLQSQTDNTTIIKELQDLLKTSDKCSEVCLFVSSYSQPLFGFDVRLVCIPSFSGARRLLPVREVRDVSE